MSTKHNKLAAEARAKAGKGAARAVRRNSQIPAVIYGDKKEPVLISLPEKELKLILQTGHFFTALCDITVGNDKHLVIPRDVQRDPVTDRAVHVDFVRVSEKTIIAVDVPLTVINRKECKGLTKGGVLNIVRHELEVKCPATNIPDEIVIDLKGLDVGDSVHISDLNLGDKVTTDLPERLTLVTLVAPSRLKSEENAAAEAAEEAGEAEKPAEEDAESKEAEAK